MRIIKITLYLIFFTALANCGFKVVNQSDLNNFDIIEITTTGDKRIGYKIKNKLIFNSNKDQKKALVINIDTKKNKTIKEKNIKNEIKKYKVELNITVKARNITNGKIINFSKSKTGDYLVAEQYSQTLKNEKKLIISLSENIADDILKELINRSYDL